MIVVKRVYWYTDWMRGVRYALRELWRSVFGCHHRWDTRSFKHTAQGSIFVNVCRKCGSSRPWFLWDGRHW